jgi:GalNAc-alpha-(1->4)-GalNAc-alpha-(1->3)-diNAcBac-PP-undecaprenol alpha-1,4-N-acetyl-D-galactosaminyltransferase
LTERVALLIHSLSGGGAERVVADLANSWSTTRQVTLITLSRTDSDRYEVRDGVRRIALDLEGESTSSLQALWRNWQRVRAVRSALRQADVQVAISFVDRMNITTLWAAKPLALPVVVCERTDYRFHEIGRFWSRQREHRYPTAQALVVQTDEVAVAARQWLPSVPVHAIPNPIPETTEAAPIRIRNGAEKTITWIGRMSTEKGVAELVDAFRIAAESLVDWKLLLVGSGAERPELERRVAQFGLQDQVEFIDWAKDLDHIYDRTSFFALPSHYEGFPNVLLECMSRGIPAISFDCPSGPRAIIRDGTDGRLISPGDVSQLAASMVDLANRPDELERLSRAAADVRERFGREAYFARWQTLLDDISADQPPQQTAG